MFKLRRAGVSFLSIVLAAGLVPTASAAEPSATPDTVAATLPFASPDGRVTLPTLLQVTSSTFTRVIPASSAPVLSGWSSTDVNVVVTIASGTARLATTKGLLPTFPTMQVNWTAAATSLSFTSTEAAANAALATLEVKAAAATDRPTISVAVKEAIYTDSALTSVYQPVYSSAGINWAQASTIASSRSILGKGGFLVAIQSATEKNFLARNFVGVSSPAGPVDLNYWTGGQEYTFGLLNSRTGWRWVGDNNPDPYTYWENMNCATGLKGTCTNTGKFNWWTSVDPNTGQRERDRMWVLNGEWRGKRGDETLNWAMVEFDVDDLTSRTTPVTASARTTALPVNVTPPSLTGEPTVGQRLIADPGVWDDMGVSDATTAFAWLRDGVVVPAATDSTFALTAADVGTRITARVTRTNLNGATQATSAQVGPIVKQGQSISFPAISDTSLDQRSLTLTASATSQLPVTLGSATADVCSVSGEVATLLAPGSCIVTASQGGNTVFSAATSVTQTFAVLKKQQTLTLSAPDTVLASDQGFDVSASSSQSLTPEIHVVSGPCTVGSARIAVDGSGTCVLEATQAGSDTVAAATNVQVRVNIVKADQSITGLQALTDTYSGRSLSTSFAATSGLPVFVDAGPAANCSFDGTELRALQPGVCTVSVTQSGNASWNSVTVAKSFAVRSMSRDKLTQVVSVSVVADAAITSGSAPMSASASSGLEVTVSSGSPAICSVGAGEVTFLAAGECLLTAIAPESSEYYAAQASATITIHSVAPTNRELPSVSGSARVGQTLSATPGSWSENGSPVTSTQYQWLVDGTAVGGATSPEYVLDAADSGRDVQVRVTKSNAAGSSSVTSSAVRAFGGPQVITVGGVQSQYRLNAGPVELTASASSGLPVTFMSLSQGVCSVNGTSATFDGVGTCLLLAQQPGGSGFDAAADQPISFAVTATAPVVSTGPTVRGDFRVGETLTADLGTWDDGGSAFSSTSIRWYRDGALVVGMTDSTYLVTVADFDTQLEVRVVQSNAFGDSIAASSPERIQRGVQETTVSGVPETIDLSVGSVTIVASSSSGLDVSLTDNSPTVCSAVGHRLRLLSAGVCEFTASQGGIREIAPADPLHFTFTVTGGVNPGGGGGGDDGGGGSGGGDDAEARTFGGDPLAAVALGNALRVGQIRALVDGVDVSPTALVQPAASADALVVTGDGWAMRIGGIRVSKGTATHTPLSADGAVTIPAGEAVELDILAARSDVPVRLFSMPSRVTPDLSDPISEIGDFQVTNDGTGEFAATISAVTPVGTRVVQANTYTAKGQVVSLSLGIKVGQGASPAGRSGIGVVLDFKPKSARLTSAMKRSIQQHWAVASAAGIGNKVSITVQLTKGAGRSEVDLSKKRVSEVRKYIRSLHRRIAISPRYVRTPETRSRTLGRVSLMFGPVASARR